MRRPRIREILASLVVVAVLVGCLGVSLAQAGGTRAAKKASIGLKACLAANACFVGAEVPGGTSASSRYNVGGPDYVDTSGNRWVGVHCAGGNDYTSPNDIAGTANGELFGSRQFEPKCSLPITNGRYEITLGWAETYRADPGYRVFAIRIEGQNIATIDVGAAAGMNSTYLRTFATAVTDGKLDIAAVNKVNRSMLALIIATPVTAAGGLVATPITTTTAPTTTTASTTTASTTTTRATTSTSTSTTRATTTSTTTATTVPTTTPIAGPVLDVGPGKQYATLQAALDSAQPGSTVRLATAGAHRGPVYSKRDGTAGQPIVVTGVPGARLECSVDDGRCFELNHSYYRLDGLSISGGSSNLYIVGARAGSYVHDVQVLNGVFRGLNGTGECIRVKYQAYNVEIARNNIADCGIGKFGVDGSKNGEGVYIGTAPEQLSSKNPSSERDATHNVWVHHNVMHPYNECVDIKEAAHDNVIEYNTCGGQRDTESGAFDSRGGTVGAGNVFRYNLVESAKGACMRFGGDSSPDGTGNSFYGNVCRSIEGYGVKQMMTPQGAVCGNRFDPPLPLSGLSKDSSIDPRAACPGSVPSAAANVAGAG